MVAANITSITITQPELCFTAIDMGHAVDSLVASMSPQLLLKSRSWANASQSLASGTTGFDTLVYNHRYNSIENLYFLSTSSDTTKSVNTWGDSWNALGSAGTVGTIQAQIGQAVYPQLPINNSNGGNAAVQQYLRECTGTICDQRNTMSIFNVKFNQYANGATASTADTPAKFIVGFPLSRINAPSPYQQISLMSGISAASMPINILLNAGSSFNSNMTFYLVAEYDVILQIDPMSKQVSLVC